MRMCRLFIISILWAFPLLATGCSDIIGDGIEELNYDDTTSSSSDSSGTGSGQTPSVNGGISGTPIPANNSADGASMTINSFDVNSTSITDGQSLNVHWNVSYSTPSLGYWTEFHLSSSPSQLSSQTQVFSRNGENNPFAAGKDETIPCSWQVGSTTSLNCTGYPPIS